MRYLIILLLALYALIPMYIYYDNVRWKDIPNESAVHCRAYDTDTGFCMLTKWEDMGKSRSIFSWNTARRHIR